MALRVNSDNALSWPETQALLNRLGIAMDYHRTLKVVIVLEKDCMAKVEQTTACVDNGPAAPEFDGR